MTQDDKELLRRACLAYLAARSTLSFCATGVARSLETRRLIDFRATVEDVTAALEYIAGDGLAEATPTTFGSTRYWQATTEGVRRAEREGLL